MKNIIGKYSCRNFNNKTLKFRKGGSTLRCGLCGETITDVIQYMKDGEVVECHPKCYAETFDVNVRNLSRYYAKVTPIKLQKNNHAVSYEIAYRLSFNDRKKILRSIDMKAFKLKYPQAQIKMAVAQEIMKRAIAQGFNIYTDDMKNFYSKKSVIV